MSAKTEVVVKPVTDTERVVALREMLINLAQLVSAAHLIPFIDRVKDTEDRGDFEAAMSDFQQELDRHK